MAWLYQATQAFMIFVLVIGVVVFCHEFGHFFFARLFNVKVEEFSIGFGKVLFQRTDRKGTHWLLKMIPLGGYIKMYGDFNGLEPSNITVTPEEQQCSFHYKPIWQKAAIIAAGPLANYLLSAILIAFLASTSGILVVPTKISAVAPGGAAEQAGLMAGDVIETFNGNKIDDFSQVKQLMMLMNPGEQCELLIKRKDKLVTVSVIPQLDKHQEYLLGVEVKPSGLVRLGILRSMHYGMQQAMMSCKIIGHAIKQIILGRRSSKQLGGPIKIASQSAVVSQHGFREVLLFMITISLNLAVANLLPIPLLDGGHLLLYGIQTVTRRPLNATLVAMFYRVGFASLLFLMLYATTNDLVQLFH